MKTEGKYQEIERKYGQPMQAVLTALFAEHGSQRAVARVLGVNQSTLYTWLLKLRLTQKTVLVSEDQLKGGEAAEPCK